MRVAYVAQTAWIQTGSVRDNILFGMPFDENQYINAIGACALEQDIKNISHRDLTEIGERGISISGRQKERIQLARAVYNDAGIYLLDDPFSAVVDASAATLFHVCESRNRVAWYLHMSARELSNRPFQFQDSVMGALRHKTVLLVTHQVEFLQAMDSILVS